MAGKTTIEWTHAPGYVGGVWNPTTGCTRVSDGCDNCYAFALHDRRYKANLDAADLSTGERLRGGDGSVRATLPQQARKLGRSLPFPKQYDLPFSRVQLLEDRLDVPLRTKKPTCYFVDSMADLFHEDVPDEFISGVWKTMWEAQQHRFLILTKRPDRMRRFAAETGLALTWDTTTPNKPWNHEVLPNVWLGTSVEDQKAADERIPHLLATPAAVRFLSCEPLLGPVNLSAYVHGPAWNPESDAAIARGGALGRALTYTREHARYIDWLIVGGESGPRSRPMDLAWVRGLRDQCQDAGVALFVKQLGPQPIVIDGLGTQRIFRLRDRKGGDMDEWPEDLRVREWPR